MCLQCIPALGTPEKAFRLFGRDNVINMFHSELCVDYRYSLVSSLKRAWDMCRFLTSLVPQET